MSNKLQRWCMIIALVVLCSAGVWAQTSNGTGGGNWSASATWAGGVVPNGSGTITITGADAITFDVLVIITGTLINNSTVAHTPGTNLTIGNGGTYQHNTALMIIPAATWSDGSTLSITATASGTTMAGGQQSFYNIIVNQSGAGTNLNLRLATAGGTGTVRGSITILSTGTGPGRIYLGDGAGTTINVAGSISVSGSSQFAVTGSSSSSVTANVGVDITVSGTAFFGPTRSTTSPGVFNITGNLSIGSGTTYSNSYTTANSNSKIAFVGSGSHTCTFSPTSVPANTTSGVNFEVAGGGTVNLNSDLTIPLTNLAGAGTLILTSGKIVTGANTIVINNPQTTAVSGGSATAYIDGKLSRVLASTSSTSLAFPIGKGTAYRPVTLTVTQDAATTTAYTAEAFNSAPAANTLPGTLDLVSLVRYYNIAKGAGANVTAGSVLLNYSTDESVTSSTNLRIAKNDGSGNWVDLGGPGTADGTGTITSTTNFTDLTSGTVFTLANNMGGGNALPVEMTSFTAAMQGANCAILKWSTATEVNNSGFEIERRSANSEQSTVNSWQKVGFVAGAGTSNSPKEYTYQDAKLVPGVYVYRIKQIDNNGAFKYSASTQVDAGVAGKNFELLRNYPNPFNPTTNLQFSVPQDGYASLKVYNMLGQEVATLFDGMAQAGHYIPVTFDGSRFASGVYFSRLQYNGKSLVQRMLMTK